MDRACELAWAAGFFEGEGCASVKTRAGAGSLTYGMLSVMSTDLDVLQRFAGILGFGSIHEAPPPKAWHKDRWVWRSTRRAEIELFAVLVGPMLGPRRSEQLRRALAGELSERQVASRTA